MNTTIDGITTKLFDGCVARLVNPFAQDAVQLKILGAEGFPTVSHSAVAEPREC